MSEILTFKFMVSLKRYARMMYNIDTKFQKVFFTSATPIGRKYTSNTIITTKNATNFKSI